MAARVAAWGLTHETVKLTVGSCKRTAVYRRIRPQLSSPCPADVWVEDRMGFVQYEAEDGPRLAWIVFVVDLDQGEMITVKSLSPDESGHNIIITEIAPATV